MYAPEGLLGVLSEVDTVPEPAMPRCIVSIHRPIDEGWRDAGVRHPGAVAAVADARLRAAQRARRGARRPPVDLLRIAVPGVEAVAGRRADRQRRAHPTGAAARRRTRADR